MKIHRNTVSKFRATMISVVGKDGEYTSRSVEETLDDMRKREKEESRQLLLRAKERTDMLGTPGDFQEIKRLCIGVVKKTLAKWEELATMKGTPIDLTPSDIRALTSVAVDLDKLERLDKGRPTDITEERVLSFTEIKAIVNSGEVDPCAKPITVEVKPLEEAAKETAKEIAENAKGSNKDA